MFSAFKSIGIDYGSAYQGIKELYIGRKQALAKLSLPSSVAETQNHFVLHPCLMDSALQACIGLTVGAGDIVSSGFDLALKPYFPFTLEELAITDPCTASMWVWIRHTKGEDRGQTLDIDLCDDQGRVCVQMKGLALEEDTDHARENAVETPSDNAPAPVAQPPSKHVDKEPFEIMCFEEVWQEHALPEASFTQQSAVSMDTLVCFLSKPEHQQAFGASMEALHPQSRIIFIAQGARYKKQTSQNYEIAPGDPKSYEEAFQRIRDEVGSIDGLLYLWALKDARWIQEISPIVGMLQAMASTPLKPKRFLLAGVCENGLERCYLESWIGFERSLRLVLPNTHVAAILQEGSSLESERGINDWAGKLWEALSAEKVESVFYRQGKRHILRVHPIPLTEGKASLTSRGTVLITGGCGGLGLLFAEHFAKTQSANLILTGRSALTPEKQSRIQALEDLGSAVFYLQADVCDTAGMKQGLLAAKQRLGPIHGVIHAAGIIEGQRVFDKAFQDFQKVLAPKIQGTLVLDDILSDEPLDFICYFSSSSAILGDFGSCDYAIGNRFQMAYGRHRNALQAQEARPGKAIVINWPGWKVAGMGTKDEEMGRDGSEQMQFYLTSSGQRLLEAQEGLVLFEQLLSQDKAQHLVLVGQPSRVHQFLGLTQVSSLPQLVEETSPSISNETPALRSGRQPEMRGFSVEQCVAWDLKALMGQQLKIPTDKLDEGSNLADFGFDSIRLVVFARLLSKHYGFEIVPSVFFGHSTLGQLSHYFLTEHGEAMQRFYQQEEATNKVSSMATHTRLKMPPLKRSGSKRSRFSPRSTSLRHSATHSVEPIAIIGMSGRFPQARTIDEMWKILAEGKHAVQEIDVERFPEYAQDAMHPMNRKWCGCIPGVAEFDPLFFEISPLEAESMDPRQRLLLQESWNALEDAGYGARQLNAQRMGMFVGVEEGDYQGWAKGGNVTSIHAGILASRLAYFLNFEGPAMAINTACSSSLVAAHQACLSLRQQECDTAIAAGVSLTFTLDAFVGMQQAGLLSADGMCYAFDKRANGMVPGEAVAAVVLKRLSQAVADGDPIHAVIGGSGINYDGRTNGITAPSGVAQAKLLQRVYEQAHVNVEDIDYIVTHGTGTQLGDPVEINALYDAFKGRTEKQGYCALTSTKSNFGHTFAASGLVSMISLVQALRYERIPVSLHCEQENDHIPWKDSPFYVNKSNKLWPKPPGKARMGAVSAFGISGTNAHMVIQDYDSSEEGVSDIAPYFLLVLSAKTEEALHERIRSMIAVLQQGDGQKQSLTQISYTLQEGRHHFQHRCAIVVEDPEDAVHNWEALSRREKRPHVFQGKVPRGFTGPKALQDHVKELLEKSRLEQGHAESYKEVLYALASFYCQGYEIAWEGLYGSTPPRRVRLPTYPFSRERYWAEDKEAPHAQKCQAVEGAKRLHSFLEEEVTPSTSGGPLRRAQGLRQPQDKPLLER